MFRIDAHVHIAATGPDDAMLFDVLDLKSMNICLAPESSPMWWRRDEAKIYEELAKRRPDQWAWCTSFPSPGAGEFNSDYSDRIIAQLQRDFAGGAVAVKVWKNVGMEDRTPKGEFLQVDHPVFEPIFRWLAAQDRPVLMHIAEPLACWLALDPASPHFDYYSSHPQWHMYGRSDFPSHSDILAARDRVLARHPTLRVIGAHFGSMEYSLDEIARRLDAFPNFAVDTSARLADFAMHESGRCTDFLSRYSDRVLWGTDLIIGPPKTGEDRAATWNRVGKVYETEFNFYGSDQMLTIGKRFGRGLGLREPLLQKLFVDNARRWYPGL